MDWRLFSIQFHSCGPFNYDMTTQFLKLHDFKLSDDLGEIDENGDYWDYFENNETEFKDSKTSKKAKRLRAKVHGKLSGHNLPNIYFAIKVWKWIWKRAERARKVREIHWRLSSSWWIRWNSMPKGKVSSNSLSLTISQAIFPQTTACKLLENSKSSSLGRKVILKLQYYPTCIKTFPFRTFLR